MSVRRELIRLVVFAVVAIALLSLLWSMLTHDIGSVHRPLTVGLLLPWSGRRHLLMRRLLLLLHLPWMRTILLLSS